MKPIQVRADLSWQDLTDNEKAAVETALRDLDTIEDPSVLTFRIETFRSRDFHKLFQYWKWPTKVSDLSLSSDDVRRIRTIMEAIPIVGSWPYVSYWVDNLRDLMEFDLDGEIVPNHGDGFHRVIAHLELKLPTIDIIFLSARVKMRCGRRQHPLAKRPAMNANHKDLEILASSPIVKPSLNVRYRVVLRGLCENPERPTTPTKFVVHNQDLTKTGEHKSFSGGSYFPVRSYGVGGAAVMSAFQEAFKKFQDRSAELMDDQHFDSLFPRPVEVADLEALAREKNPVVAAR